MGVVSGGSDLHVLLALKRADVAGRMHGPSSPLARLASDAARQAHVMRYGRVSDGMMSRLMQHNRELHLGAKPDAAGADA